MDEKFFKLAQKYWKLFKRFVFDDNYKKYQYKPEVFERKLKD